MKTNTSAMVNFVVLFCCTALFAQQDSPFFEQHKMFVRGNSVLIGNTILGNDSKLSFNDREALRNQVDLRYVDVDDDDTTFSSSSASFTLPDTAKNIKYAGLYWAGLYPANNANKIGEKNNTKYKPEGEREKRVQDIQLKLNDGDYQTIEGQVVFENPVKGPFVKESPYSCFADITSQIENQKGATNITVANILAPTGYIETGASAGWLLYIVYEDATETAKYFTSYTGLKEVNKEKVEFVFKDLKPKNLRVNSASILAAILGGDATSIKGDAYSVFNDTKDLVYPSSSKRKSTDNLVDSAVPFGYDVEITRTPNSKNTLGFDLLKMNVPNNTITTNDADAVIQLSTAQKRFYTFFLAFETEIEEVGDASLEDVELLDAIAEREVNNNLKPYVVDAQLTFRSSIPLLQNNPIAFNEKYKTLSQVDEDEFEVSKEVIALLSSNGLASNIISQQLETGPILATEEKKPISAITEIPTSITNKNIPIKIAVVEATEKSKEVVIETSQVKVPIVSKPAIAIEEPVSKPLAILETIVLPTPVAVVEEKVVVIPAEIVKKKPIAKVEPKRTTIKKPIEKVFKTLPVITKPIQYTEPMVVAKVEKEKISEEKIIATPQVNVISPIASKPVIAKSEPVSTTLPVIETRVTPPPVEVVEEKVVVIPTEIIEKKPIDKIKPTQTKSAKPAIKIAETLPVSTETIQQISSIIVTKNDVQVAKVDKEKVEEESPISAINSSSKMIKPTLTKTATSPKKQIIKHKSTNTKKVVSALELLNTSSPSINNDEMKNKVEYDRIKNSEAIVALDAEPGYYLVTKIFSNKTLAVMWMRKLDRQGYNVQMFTSSKARLFYIFIEKSLDIEKMQNRQKTVSLNLETKETRVYKVNL